MSAEPLDRRTFLSAAAATLAGLAAGCTGGDSSAQTAEDGASTTRPTTTAAAAATAESTPTAPDESNAADAEASVDQALRPADFEQLDVCALVPRQAEGPFPNRDELIRRDITEASPGWPVRLGFRVVDGACVPLPGLLVDVWHCDATGDYSSYTDDGTGKDDGEGTTYLRGTQQADDDGIVEFGTVFPGWYEGRAIHIHVTVRDGDSELHTTQMYFPEEVIRTVLASPVYAEFGQPDTSNADDDIGRDARSSTLLLTVRPETVTNDDTPMLALGNLGIDA